MTDAAYWRNEKRQNKSLKNEVICTGSDLILKGKSKGLPSLSKELASVLRRIDGGLRMLPRHSCHFYCHFQIRRTFPVRKLRKPSASHSFYHARRLAFHSECQSEPHFDDKPTISLLFPFSSLRQSLRRSLTHDVIRFQVLPQTEKQHQGWPTCSTPSPPSMKPSTLKMLSETQRVPLR